MANQDYVSVSGIGKDPSGSYSQSDGKWTESEVYGSRKYTSKPGEALTVPDTTVGGTVYSAELCLMGDALKGANFTLLATGEADIEATWQWYDAAAETYDDNGNKVEGAWTNFRVPAASAQDVVLDPSVALDNRCIEKASKFRVYVIWDSMGSNSRGSGIDVNGFACAYATLNSSASKNLSGSVVANPDPS